MANVTNNLLVRGASGNVGKQFVYRNRGNQTTIARMPIINKNLVPTEAQEAVRELFASASVYASGIADTPELKAQYQKKATAGKTANNVAFRDFLKAPVVRKIDAEKYNGTVGSVIVINAKDNFKVTEVKVSIYNAGGGLVEEGMALPNSQNRLLFLYTATQLNAIPAGSVIKASAWDLAGNKGELSITL